MICTTSIHYDSLRAIYNRARPSSCRYAQLTATVQNCKNLDPLHSIIILWVNDSTSQIQAFRQRVVRQRIVVAEIFIMQLKKREGGGISVFSYHINIIITVSAEYLNNLHCTCRRRFIYLFDNVADDASWRVTGTDNTLSGRYNSNAEFVSKTFQRLEKLMDGPMR